MRTQREGRLRIAASLTVAEYLVPTWLVDLRARRAQTTVALRVANSDDVAGFVLSSGVDIGFMEGLGLPDGLASSTARDHAGAGVAGSLAKSRWEKVSPARGPRRYRL